MVFEAARPVEPGEITDRARFADALTQLRLTADLSVREVARRTKQRASTLGGWFSGQHLPQRSQREVLCEVLRLCGVPEEALSAWVEALERARTAPAQSVPLIAEPYRGLQSYESGDAEWFFGREALTEQTVDQIAAALASPAPRLVAVVAPSGAGKSSLLRAGVIPAVLSRGVPGVEGAWRAGLITPGASPSAAWDAATSADEQNALVVIDQFEELFQPDVPESERTAFLEHVLSTAAPEAQVPTVVIIGLRADFYGAAARYPALAAAMQTAQVLVTPMDEAQLRRAITEPAQRAGATVDPELVELLIRELVPRGSLDAHDAGALPLLSHALRATWEAARGRNLSVADYLACGGISGAVQQTAERIFTQLAPADQDLARRVFVRLVSIDPMSAVMARRHVDHDDLPAAGAGASLERVLHQFVGGRLLTAHEDSVEISHEALLSSWGRLREWLDADRTALRLQRRLEGVARNWLDSGYDAALLLRGAQLVAAQELLAQNAELLSRPEHDLVQRSTEASEAEQTTERRRLRRTRQMLTAVAVLALVAIASTAVTLHANASANRDRRTAVQTSKAALSRQVALEARDLVSHDPALAEQLALVAYRTAPTAEARSALLDQSALPSITRVLGGAGPTSLALSKDGKIVAVGHGDDGSVHLFRLSGNGILSPLGIIPGKKDGEIYALSFFGKQLAVGGTGGAVELWDVSDPAHPQQTAAPTPAFTGGAVQAIAISPDGHTLAAVSAGPAPIRLWDVSDPTAPRALPNPPGVPDDATEQGVAFSPDGSLLVAGGTGGTIYDWRTADLAAAPTTAVVDKGTSRVDTVMIDSKGRLFAGDRLGVIEVRDAHTLALQRTLRLGTNSWVNTLTESPDGTRVAAGSSDNQLTEWDTTTWAAISHTAHPDPVTGVAYTPDGSRVVTTATDGALRTWATAAEVTPDPDSSVFSVVYTDDGHTLGIADNGGNGAGHLWDVSGTRPVAAGTISVGNADGTLDLSGDGTLAAVGSYDGHVQLWNTRDPAHPSAIGAPFAAAGALIEWLKFSADDNTLLVGADDGQLHLWDVSAPAAPVQRANLSLGGQVFTAVLSPDGKQLAATDSDAHVYLWQLGADGTPGPKITLGGFTTYVYNAAFSPDGKLLAATGADHYTRLWSLADPAHPQPVGGPLTGPTAYSLSVSFSPDNALLAVGSNDGSVWLYDLRTKTPTRYATLQAVGGDVNAAMFDPAGGHLAAGGRSSVVRIWETDPDAYAAQICASAGDPITKTEWTQYVPGAAYAPPCG